MKRLLIDSGNTHIKWAMVNGDCWVGGGRLPVGQADTFSQHLAEKSDALSMGLQGIEQMWVSNVAGEEVASYINNIGASKNIQPLFVTPREQQCGVHNGYSQPGQLGSDRWAALLGAWHLERTECLVVNCGTATTIDTLTEKGEFVGGLILPGVRMMLNSLCASTSRLKISQGSYVPMPKNTADAMFSGMIQASCGAIQRQYSLLENDNAPLVLSGGAAEVLRSHINIPLRVVDDLVLQGLLLMAQEASDL